MREEGQGYCAAQWSLSTADRHACTAIAPSNGDFFYWKEQSKALYTLLFSDVQS